MLFYKCDIKGHIVIIALFVVKNPHLVSPAAFGFIERLIRCSDNRRRSAQRLRIDGDADVAAAQKNSRHNSATLMLVDHSCLDGGLRSQNGSID